MEIRCNTEAKRLHLYHLASLFFHEQREDLSITCKEEDPVTVRITLGNTEGVGTAPVDLSLHKEKNRGENAALGKAFFLASRALTDYIPPYGILFGVRPVKVPLFYLESGLSKEKVRSLLREEFYVSEEKTALLLSLAQTELAFSSTLSSQDAMLYLSIPFCPSRCRYCSFISSAAPDHLALIPQYVDALVRDIRLTGQTFSETGKRLRAVYMGGGTPGILSANEMKQVLGEVKKCFDRSELLEFCVEIGRPDTVTEEKLSVLKEAGVDRISINPQTTCNETLARIGRGHSKEDFFLAMELAKKYDFASINCDLIAGLEGEEPADFLHSLNDVLSLSPAEVTLHALCKKRSAALSSVGHHQPQAWQKAMEEAQKICINSGLAPYYLYRQKDAVADLENTGFAKKCRMGIYNLAMMEDLCDIFACGAGAIGKIIPKNRGERIRRYAGFKYPFEYLSCPDRTDDILCEMKRNL